MNPYKILQVESNCNLETLRNAFKKIALKVHPDKGGNQDMFNITVEAYKTIFRTLQKKERSKDFIELKNEFGSLKSNTNKHVSFDDENFDEKKFNRVFDENKFYNPSTDDGYGDFMVKSTKSREKIEVEKKNIRKSDFNSEFDQQEIQNKEITLFKEPEALCLSKKLAYDELGVTKIDDYSSDTSKSRALGYTDYMKAHTTNKLIDKNAIREKESFKSFDDISSKRGSQKFELSDADKANIEQAIISQKTKEEKRQLNLEEYDTRVEEHYKRVNKMMLS